MTAQHTSFEVTSELRGEFRQWRTRAGIVGVIGLVLLAVGFFTSPFQFYRSYLWSWS